MTLLIQVYFPVLKFRLYLGRCQCLGSGWLSLPFECIQSRLEIRSFMGVEAELEVIDEVCASLLTKTGNVEREKLYLSQCSKRVTSRFVWLTFG